MLLYFCQQEFQFIQVDGLGKKTGAARGQALFAIPFVVAIWLLNQLPIPTEHDIAARTERPRMDLTDRWRFLRVFLPGIGLAGAVVLEVQVAVSVSVLGQDPEALPVDGIDQPGNPA